MKSPYVIKLDDVNQSMIGWVGGKGANLGELRKINGINVPDGFCVTTEAYREAIKNPVSIPEHIKKDILPFIDEHIPYAVRSSATAEDLPTASFAGQHDTFLNIVGKESVLEHIIKCWKSLFNERAITYRHQNGFDDSKIYLSVVVQKMVPSEVSGVLFTADPITSNRTITSIDATFGLGEALVSGLINTDIYKVRDGKIDIERKLQEQPALNNQQILELEQIGRKIEAHFGSPQDIEWCLVNNIFYIVQSRPITTLFPIPETNDNENHVYVSVGHQQMMTDAMKPLGLSFNLLRTFAPMYQAGGRLFVDVTYSLDKVVHTLGHSDPLTKDALLKLMARNGQHKTPEAPKNVGRTDYSPSLANELIQESEKALQSLKDNIQTKSGVELLDFILEDNNKLKKSLSDPRNIGMIIDTMSASWWINDKMYEWLGEKNAADTLSQSVPNNVTSEMGTALLDIADMIRPHPEVIRYLQNAKDNHFLDDLPNSEIRNAIHLFLDKYGMRCAGEIDITRPNWIEKPITLIPIILNNIKTQEPGAGKRKFEQGLREALNKEQDLLNRLQSLPGGDQKAEETKGRIYMIRNFNGYREYPKYAIINRAFVYKQALLKEAARLKQNNVIQNIEDIDYLYFEELREVIRTQQLDYDLIHKRKEEYKFFEKLTPPRVITSEGEIITGNYNREGIPLNAMAGLAVSSGVIEGRARVILDMANASLEEGDILVTSFTDPGWTPLFVSIKGLVTEVGGLMTHGAVIAREYGLPAVVGVPNATKLIKDGQRIRVNGSDGFIEIL